MYIERIFCIPNQTAGHEKAQTLGFIYWDSGSTHKVSLQNLTAPPQCTGKGWFRHLLPLSWAWHWKPWWEGRGSTCFTELHSVSCSTTAILSPVKAALHHMVLPASQRREPFLRTVQTVNYQGINYKCYILKIHLCRPYILVSSTKSKKIQRQKVMWNLTNKWAAFKTSTTGHCKALFRPFRILL